MAKSIAPSRAVPERFGRFLRCKLVAGPPILISLEHIVSIRPRGVSETCKDLGVFVELVQNFFLLDHDYDVFLTFLTPNASTGKGVEHV